jgi:hypothetical protein
MPVAPTGLTWPLVPAALVILEHLFYNCSWHGTAVRFVPFLLPDLSAILSRKREMMALPFGLPPLIARTPFVSPKLGIYEHKRVYQPGKEGARLHGVFASRHLHLSKCPIFVPPLFLLICLFNRLFNPARQSLSYGPPVAPRCRSFFLSKNYSNFHEIFIFQF